jgi:hypothetical protein
LGNINFLIIDISFPFALTLLLLSIKRKALKEKFNSGKIDNNILYFALLVIASIGYQFPLADLGHKWWSTSFSAIFLAHLIGNGNIPQLKYRNHLRIKKVIVFASIFSIMLSAYFGLLFMAQNRQTINDYEITNFNGLNYPMQDSENVDNFLISLKVLSRIEMSGFKINYVCPEGLYYLRSNGYASEAKNSLKLNVKFDESYPVNFICRYSEKNVRDIAGFTTIKFGNKTQIAFLVKNSAAYLNDDIQGWIEKFLKDKP